LAIARYFPQARQLLCIFHINQAVQAKIQKEILGKEEEFYKSFLSDWKAVIAAKTKDEWKEKWKDLIKDKGRKRMKKYFERTWLPLKEKFCHAWTDDCMHFNQRATSRVDGSHNSLKRAIKVSTRDLKHVVDALKRLVDKQVNEWHYKMNATKIRLVQAYQIPLFD